MLALWTIQTTGAIQNLKVTAGSALSDSFAFSADSSLLAACGSDQMVIWPLQTPASPRIIRRPGLASGGGFLFTADGPILIAGIDSEGLLECWDARNLQRVGELRSGPSAHPSALALSFDGRMLATAGSENAVQLWDWPSRTKLKEFRHRGAWVDAMAFSPDGKTLVGGTVDGALRFWNVASGSEITTLAAHVSACRSISFSPDGRCLATAEVADTIKLWLAPSFSESDLLSQQAVPR